MFKRLSSCCSPSITSSGSENGSPSPEVLPRSQAPEPISGTSPKTIPKIDPQRKASQERARALGSSVLAGEASGSREEHENSGNIGRSGAHATCQSKIPPQILNPKTESRTISGCGAGLFAVDPIATGEIIVQWTGIEMERSEFEQTDGPCRVNAVQIGPGKFLVPETLAPGDYVNHSCAPNGGLRGDRTLVAMRDIAAGEQVCYDYAMSDTEPYDEFECGCGAPMCRGQVSGDDWKRPELQERYRGFFSEHVAEQIAALPYVEPHR